jgi:hypothetical protein
MKTLVIHPQDSSTDFLIPIYMNLKSFPDFNDVTIIRGGMTKDEVNEQIKQHDRIMMMGHGSPHGLFSVGKFDDMYLTGLIIDKNTVCINNKYYKLKETYELPLCVINEVKNLNFPKIIIKFL